MLNLLIELTLDLLGLLLLEEDLVLVVDLGLGQALVTLLTNIVKSLLKAHLLRVIELLQLSQLLLRLVVNLSDSVLQLLLFLFDLLLEFVDALLQTLLRLLHFALVLRMLLLAQGQVLVAFLFSLGE